MLADIFGPDLLIVAIVLVVLLFGGAAIPKLARNLGSAKNEFEKGLDDGKKARPPRASSTASDSAATGRGEVLRQLTSATTRPDVAPQTTTQRHPPRPCSVPPKAA